MNPEIIVKRRKFLWHEWLQFSIRRDYSDCTIRERKLKVRLNRAEGFFVAYVNGRDMVFWLNESMFQYGFLMYRIGTAEPFIVGTESK